MEIDVSECEHFYQYDQCKNTCHWFGTPCEWVDTKECTYKQLQQLKAENEELRMLNKGNADNYVRWRDKIEAENKKLKQEIASLELDYNALYDAPTISEERYKTALDEIKEIIFKRQIEHYCYCDECSPFKQILQLIKQAKEGGE